RYYLLGGTLLYSAFAPMTSSAEQRLNSNYSGDSSSGGCGSSCGSSCGGGCGGGCGGCGGD
ncbi:MAG TPA: hypothetical protein VK154_11130, partial [Chitinophagales bacterium]|nr:hypothetical protein [Chitinophagales bacterium]